MIDYRKKLLLTIIVTILFVSVIGVTYAFFGIDTKGNEESKTHTITSASRLIEYTDLELITNQNIEPGWTSSKTIVVENIGTKNVTYNLVWQSVTNELSRKQDMIFSVACTSNIPESTCPIISSSQFPNTGIDQPIFTNINLALNEKHTYIIKIEYLNQSADQSIDMNKTIKGKIGAKDL